MISKINDLFNQNRQFWNVTDQEWEQNRPLLQQKFQVANLTVSLEVLDNLRKEAIKQNSNSFEEYHAPDDNHVFSNEFDGFYSLREDGVYFFEKNANGFGLKICNYLIVTELFTTDAKEVGRGLTWRNEYSGDLISRFFFNDEIYDTKNLIKILMRYGLRVTTVSSKRNYLFDYINSCLPEKRSFKVTQPGWVCLGRNYSYVRPGFIIGSQPIPLIAPDNFKENCKQRGSLEDWQLNIGQPALSSSRAVFACATVLASTCLKFVGDVRLRVGFNFVGSSTSGKTLAMKIGLSVAGNPKTLTHTWWGNNNGLSALVKEHNDFICALDEMSTLSKKEEAVDIAYILLGGQEKNRANTVGTRLKESNNEWNVMLLSTGEEGLSSLAYKSGKDLNTGAELRILDIPLSASSKYGVNEYLPKGCASIQDYGLQMKESIHQYYGVVFQVFLSCLCSKLNDPDNANAVKDLKNTIIDFAKKFVEKYAKGKTAQVKMAAYCFGFVAAVGDLACGGSDGYLSQKSIFGWNCSTADRTGPVEVAVYSCFKDWLSQFEADKIAGNFCIEESDDKETQKILKRVYELFDSKVAFFADKNMNRETFDRTFRRECIGYYEDVTAENKSGEFEQQRIFYLTTKSFDEYIQSNSNRSKVIKVLNDKKIISQTVAKSKRIKCQNRPVKVWTFVLP